MVVEGRVVFTVAPGRRLFRAGVGLAVVAAWLLSWIVFAPPAHACSCMSRTEAEQDAQAPIIVLGVVQSDRLHENRWTDPDGRTVIGPGDIEYGFDVEAVLKGSIDDP